ncbi:hypothetical protein SAMN05421747_11836 [Parapedobacter composti]|uniref:Uncharacterized protein n=1 Tax=Parapedobacter composti TaxID=623281 RepID=A0A1I1L1U2_9SPHI|nr:hypothetical protein SAMN05421747_11836 [Parapedobacter composti]
MIGGVFSCLRDLEGKIPPENPRIGFRLHKPGSRSLDPLSGYYDGFLFTSIDGFRWVNSVIIAHLSFGEITTLSKRL